jgi:hypothetical protein
MFGEHYGSFLVASGALVDLENEFISKFVENQKMLQLQKLFKIPPSFSTKFPGIFLPPYLFSCC